jgi:hypothetical protein
LSTSDGLRAPAAEPVRDRPAEPPQELPAPAIPALLGNGNGFRWFRELEPVWPDAEPDVKPAEEPVPETDSETGGGETRGGLRRRVRGAQLPSPGTSAPAATADEGKPRHDPEATKAAMDGFASAFAKAAEVTALTTDPPPAPPTVVTAPVSPPPVRVPVGAPPVATAPITAAAQSRDGLIRRVPGAQLAPGLRQQTAGRPIARAVANRTRRDPAAERAAFDAFAAGLAKAEDVTADSPPQGVVAGRVMERGEESRK